MSYKSCVSELPTQISSLLEEEQIGFEMYCSQFKEETG